MDENNSIDPNAFLKARRPVTILAAFGILVISGAAVGGLIYDLAVNGNQQSLTQLGTLATLGLGGLLALSGNKSKNGD
jgi:hypothetical protein